MSSFLASSISSSDICASRCLFSWSIEGSFKVLDTTICCPLATDPFPLRLPSRERGAGAIWGSGCPCIWLDPLTWLSLVCLNLEGPVLILCVGKPVSALLSLGGAGGFASDKEVRSLMSFTKSKFKADTCAGPEEWTASGSSSESKLIWKR